MSSIGNGLFKTVVFIVLAFVVLGFLISTTGNQMREIQELRGQLRACQAGMTAESGARSRAEAENGQLKIDLASEQSAHAGTRTALEMAQARVSEQEAALAAAAEELGVERELRSRAENQVRVMQEQVTTLNARIEEQAAHEPAEEPAAAPAEPERSTPTPAGLVAGSLAAAGMGGLGLVTARRSRQGRRPQPEADGEMVTLRLSREQMRDYVRWQRAQH